MVTVKKKTKGSRTYYYLEHAYRKQKKVLKKEKYLGITLPKNLESVKKEFLHELYKEKWYPVFERIKKVYSQEWKDTPSSARKKQQEAFSIRFTYDTQRIEGSKLTLRETANLLEKGITPTAKPVADVKEAEAHAKLLKEMLEHKKDLTLSVVLLWHRKLFLGTKQDIAGKVRKHGVSVSGSKFAPPSPVEVEPLLEDFFKWYISNRNKLHAVELAALVHLKFVTIHPFADGNGRISRLLMNFVLHKNRYPMFNISYKNRSSYYTALERSQVKQHDAIFVQWFFKKYAKEYRRYLGNKP
jgi:Fic family protein